jgi:hypothetical protein
MKTFSISPFPFKEHEKIRYTTTIDIMRFDNERTNSTLLAV